MAVNDYIVRQSKDTKVSIKDVTLKKDPLGYCLDITYRIETDTSVDEFHMPRVQLPISTSGFGVRLEEDWGMGSDYVADLGFGKLNLLPDKDGHIYYAKNVKEKTKEMTLAEIEKKLGHKVKIVNK